MSYKHYWGRPLELPRDRFRLFAAECRELRQALGVPFLGLFGGVGIGGALGTGDPTFTQDAVCFNGRPGYETFLIHPLFHHPAHERGDYDLYWDFVATAQRPYDTLVVAALLSFKYHFPEAALNSDGGEQDWARGINLYQRATRRKAPSFRELAAPQA